MSCLHCDSQEWNILFSPCCNSDSAATLQTLAAACVLVLLHCEWLLPFKFMLLQLPVKSYISFGLPTRSSQSYLDIHCKQGQIHLKFWSTTHSWSSTSLLSIGILANIKWWLTDLSKDKAIFLGSPSSKQPCGGQNNQKWSSRWSYPQPEESDQSRQERIGHRFRNKWSVIICINIIHGSNCN